MADTLSISSSSDHAQIIDLPCKSALSPNHLRVNLRKEPKGILGLTLRGGWDHPLLEMDNGIFITNIRNNSIGSKANLSVGDKILEVNGIPLINLSHQTVVSLFESAKTEVTLLIEKGALDKLSNSQKSDKSSSLKYKLLIGAGIVGVAAIAYAVYRSGPSKLLSRLSSLRFSSV